MRSGAFAARSTAERGRFDVETEFEVHKRGVSKSQLQGKRPIGERIPAAGNLPKDPPWKGNGPDHEGIDPK